MSNCKLSIAGRYRVQRGAFDETCFLYREMYDLSQYVIASQIARHVTLKCILNPVKRSIVAKLINLRHITLLSAWCNGNVNEYVRGWAIRCKKRDVHECVGCGGVVAQRSDTPDSQVRKARRRAPGAERMHIQRGTCVCVHAGARLHVCAIVVIGIIKIRGLKLFRFMPALSCRRAVVSSCAVVPSRRWRGAIRFRGTNFMHYSGPRSRWKRSSRKKSRF